MRQDEHTRPYFFMRLGRSEDDWAFASPTPSWYHVALSCTPILPLSTCGVTSQSFQPVGVDHRVTRDEKTWVAKGELRSPLLHVQIPLYLSSKKIKELARIEWLALSLFGIRLVCVIECTRTDILIHERIFAARQHSESQLKRT